MESMFFFGVDLVWSENEEFRKYHKNLKQLENSDTPVKIHSYKSLGF